MDIPVVEDTTVDKVVETPVNGETNKLLIEWMVLSSPISLSFEGKKS